ncbi:aspartate kinase [Ancylobacter sp. MQZ15Z-1]|uniref:Aspartate kinase n=1 Tax=Ancylobacter mangrovi TaxID=2972472 RepID=A0A9X2PDT2_9HYPH|nr:aspartate kinase [Ancylobacter mangrovi]MCS0494130.1 aspartate kinase [Ancylobacter mangrovi]
MPADPLAAPAPRPHVVKLGGSLIGAPALSRLLQALARARTPVLLVTGGGPFADAVREAQPRLGLSDAACHRMAILAMEQTALAFADLAPGLVPVDSADAIARASEGARPAIWLPARMALAALELPESWALTSDSLAAWLAGSIGAGRLTLVKSAPAAPGSGPRDWAAGGLVDPLFPDYAGSIAGPVEVMSLEAALGHFTDGSLAA